MYVEVICVRERFRVFIPILRVIRDVTTNHGGDGVVEAFYLAVLLLVVCQGERFFDAKYVTSVLVQLFGNLRAII